ncbi:contact-dependent growth inhibition system immunity protein [Caballeronia sp. GAWG2-1]|uniref:contact-dependent growth inhibition system immunity protein n=1 Tax=Caballeronia sp. GAWG2-1 TaxID=2921744 RepID=UPI002028E993|nr:contact-dependent growth inhibition system immunity protein [Caballeronia sp. GAWG2-1]
MIRQKFPELEQLLGCYFHQDWTEEFDEDTLVLQAIIKSESKDRLAAAASELNILLGLGLSEAELSLVLVNQLGCYFDPRAKGLTCLQWLKQVSHEFKSLKLKRQTQPLRWVCCLWRSSVSSRGRSRKK